MQKKCDLVEFPLGWGRFFFNLQTWFYSLKIHLNIGTGRARPRLVPIPWRGWQEGWSFAGLAHLVDIRL